jgi:hypothetical protein
MRKKMELKEIVAALEDNIKLKTEEFARIDKEHAAAKSTFMNDLRAIEALIRKTTPTATDALDVSINKNGK